MKIQDELDKAEAIAEAQLKDNSAEIKAQRLAQNDAFWKLIYNPDIDTLPNYQPWEPRPHGQRANEMQLLKEVVIAWKTQLSKRVSNTAYDFDTTQQYYLRQLISPGIIDEIKQDFEDKLKELERQDLATFHDITKNPLYAEVLAMAQWVHIEAPRQEAYRKTLIEKRKQQEKDKAKQAAEMEKKREEAAKHSEARAKALTEAKLKQEKAAQRLLEETRARRMAS